MKRKALILISALTTATACNHINMLVGTYTDSGSYGIYSYRLDQTGGQVLILDSLAMENPSYLTVSRDGSHLYAVSENNDSTAALAAVSFDAKSGRMQMASVPQATGGGDPCHVATNGRIAVTANYSGGSMSVFPIAGDGTIAACSQLFKGNTAGQAAPQDKAHIHMARFMDDGSILATDFSADQLLRFEIGEDGKVKEPVVVGKTEAGSAPRHFEFSKDERFVYVMSELAGTVTVFKKDGHGMLDRIQVIASDSLGGRGGADIHLSHDGRFLYASNRLKEDGISIFRVDRQSGKLEKTGYQPTGIHPRNFAITPNDKLLLCACRDSNSIQVFSRKRKTGLLKYISSIPLQRPVCVKFAE